MIVLAAVVLGGVLIRLSMLDRPMSYDEAFTFDAYAIRPFTHIVSTYSLPNNQILHTLLTHVAWLIFGNHLWSVRLTAFLSGCALVPVSYALGRELYDRRAGLWAAGLVATFAALIDFSVDARGYTLGILLVLVTLWLGVTLLKRHGEKAPTRWSATLGWTSTEVRPPLLWVAFAVCAALSIYTIPTMALGTATVVIWMAGITILRRPKDYRFLLWLGGAVGLTALLALLLYAPVLGQQGWNAQTLAATWGNVSSLALKTWRNWNRAAPHPLDWLVLLGFVLSLVLHRRIAKHSLPLAIPALLVVVVTILFGPLSHFKRTWLYLLPLYLIMAGAGLAWLATRAGSLIRHPENTNAAAAAIVTVLLGIAALTAGPRGGEEPPTTDNNIAGFVRTHLTPGEPVAIDHNMITPAYYYFRRNSYFPPLFASGSLRPGPARVLVLMIGHPTSLAPVALLRSVSATKLSNVRVTLLRQFDYITAYEVQAVASAQLVAGNSFLPSVWRALMRTMTPGATRSSKGAGT